MFGLGKKKTAQEPTEQDVQEQRIFNAKIGVVITLSIFYGVWYAAFHDNLENLNIPVHTGIVAVLSVMAGWNAAKRAYLHKEKEE